MTPVETLGGWLRLARVELTRTSAIIPLGSPVRAWAVSRNERRSADSVPERLSSNSSVSARMTEGVVVAAQPYEVSLEQIEQDDVSVVHQTLRREVNEQVRRLSSRLDGAQTETMDVVCECAYTGCTGRVEMAISDYETVRRFPTRFVIKAGHEVTEFERVVDEADSYVVVEKIGDGGSYALRADPRRRRRIPLDRGI
jgi:hypothetical protein